MARTRYSAFCPWSIHIHRGVKQHFSEVDQCGQGQPTVNISFKVSMEIRHVLWSSYDLKTTTLNHRSDEAISTAGSHLSMG